MNDEGIKFISDIFENLIITGGGCSCTVITPDYTFIAGVLKIVIGGPDD